MSDPRSSRRQTDDRISRIRRRTRRTQTDATSERADGSEDRTVSQVRREWEHLNLYVPAELDDRLDAVRDEMDEAVEAEFGGTMAVTRHLYPVVLKLGLDRLEDLSATEFADCVDSIPGVGADELER